MTSCRYRDIWYHKKFDEVHFKNGYHKDAPFVRVNHIMTTNDIMTNPMTDKEERMFKIHLGKIIEIKNWKGKTNAR